jgi:signal transduction histidine kinase
MIEPGLLRVFKIFVLFQIALFAALVALDLLLYNYFTPVIQARNILSVTVWFGLFVYLSWPRLHYLLKRYYLPLALIVASVFPMISNQPVLKLTIEKNLPGIVISIWQLLPALFVPLILIAWQYPFKVVLLFCLYTAFFDFYLLMVVTQSVYIPFWIIMGLVSTRTLSFGIVGYMISTLIANQRKQRADLQNANVQLMKQAEALEHLAVTRERNRLAREFHDTLAHTLSGMAVNLEAIKTVVPAEQTEVQEMLDHSLLAARKGLKETRRTLHNLRPTQLEDLGLCDALAGLLNSAAERAEFKINSRFPGQVLTLLPEVEQAVYRIAQEALENVIRHAEATFINFSLDSLPEDGFCMIIKDNGVGIKPKDLQPSDHYGIQGMRERAESIHAQLSIFTAPEGGTVVELKRELK